MGIDAVSAGLSGLRAAQIRQRNSASNVSNLLTDGYRNLRTQQADRSDGGTTATTTRDADPEPVSLVNEFTEQTLAKVQSGASIRAIETALDLQKQVLDIFV